MSEIRGPALAFLTALGAIALASLLDNRCEPLFALMVGGCR
jgi:hypothetical protein